MIKSELSRNEFDALSRDMKLIGADMDDPGMQLYRAKKFRDFTVERVSSGNLSLRPIKKSTKIIHGKAHPPEWNKGHVVSKMSSRTMDDGSAEAGFFDDSSMIPGKNITVTKAVILQHTGYRIPLTGEKGEKVRKWLAWKGVFSDPRPNSAWRRAKSIRNEGWIIVRPRPFVFTSATVYNHAGLDVEAAVEYMNKKRNEAFNLPQEEG